MKVTAREIAEITGGEIQGNPDVTVTGFATIEDAGKGDLSFISNPKYYHYASTTSASVLIVSDNFSPDTHVAPTLIKVSNPYATLAQLMHIAESARPKPHGIENPVFVGEGSTIPDDIYLGAFTYIGKNVVIGKGVSIYPQTYIGDNCIIGDGTIIYAGVKIYPGCKVGSNCILHSGSVVGADGFGFAPINGHFTKVPQLGGVIIEDNVEIGANTTIDRATFGNTIIGKGTKLDNLIQIAHNVQIGKDNVFAAQTGVAGSTVIGDSNRFGGQCGFNGHIKVGNRNEIGAQSGIHNNIGDDKRMIGYPAVEVRQFAKNLINMKKLADFFEKQKNNK
ncbi:MAG: UDP-3-O-(3-hydroxymyristoyl)glucosamine N-acyltransferase [Muribaculaceae bacterium]|nr:UDP-3-O-(3-hydroxymyristoyl)glucosamine N-acyltransferase [Muribaculaceae bacterium]